MNLDLKGFGSFLSASFRGSGNHYERWIFLFLKDPGKVFKGDQKMFGAFILHDAEIEARISLIKTRFVRSVAGGK